MNILVLASGFAPQYRVLRCAAATGAAVYILGDKRAVWLAISRYCRKFVDWQVGWDVAAPSVVAALNEIIAEHSIDCVVPSDALTTRFLSLVRKDLQCRTFPVPDTHAFDQLNTKDAFAKLCARLAIPVS